MKFNYLEKLFQVAVGQDKMPMFLAIYSGTPQLLIRIPIFVSYKILGLLWNQQYFHYYAAIALHMSI